MATIDVEKIVEDIRTQIPGEGESWDALRFEDIPVDAVAGTGESAAGRFNQDEFDRHAIIAAESWPVPFFREVPGGWFKRLCKRVVRKLIRFCLEPVTQDDTNFHHVTAICLSGLRRFVAEQLLAEQRREAELSRLRGEILTLEERLAALETRVK